MIETKNPNPQGKGLVPSLASLYENRVRVTVPAKHIVQLGNELFTSLFVLYSAFQFKPVVGKQYWMYQRSDRFELSLLSPDDWRGRRDDCFVAECVLQADMTWSLELGRRAQADQALIKLIEKRRRLFDGMLRNADNINELLPHYIAELPFHQRVSAAVMANSLQQSMRLSGIHGMGYHKALEIQASEKQATIE